LKKGPSIKCSLGVQNVLLNHYPERLGKGILYRSFVFFCLFAL
jgi:hypothetical protein